MRARVVFHNDGTTSYFVEGRKVDREEYDRLVPSKDGIPWFAPIQDWSAENGGRGREISQLRADPTAPKVYAHSPAHALELAKHRGYDRAERT